jgi:carboxyl-terminal processing protease
MSRSSPLALFALAFSLAVVSCVGGAPPDTPAPSKPGESLSSGPAVTIDPDEPVRISGTIPFTSPFFINTIAEPFVLLEDEAGFVSRDREFVFPLAGQTIGPVEVIDDQTLAFNLTLPAVPQGTQVDLDKDGEQDPGVMVFAVAYWSNTWGGPFLESRDGKGWSNAYTSVVTDPDRQDEIQGGTLVIWAPDDGQEFPTGFGEDEKLFTEDDPVGPIPAGYSLVDLDSQPFRIYKEPEPELVLVEGEGQVNDFSDLSYREAFDKLFEKASREYPFTEEKDVDWDALYNEFAPRITQATDDNAFYRVVHDFTTAIPDAHVGVSFNDQVFFEENGGGLGLVLEELSDGRVIVTSVIQGSPATSAGVEVGAEILTWEGQPVDQALDQVEPFLGPFSTDHHKRQQQLIFLTRTPPGTSVTFTFHNPGSEPEQASLVSTIEYDSLILALYPAEEDELALPVEGSVLDDSGLGYIRISTFSGDYNLMARVWEYHLENLVAAEVPGLIIDVRVNGGGNGGLAFDFIGYLFDEGFVVYQNAYYNDRTGQFEYLDVPSRVEAAPLHYDGPVAVLVSPDCVSACEGFTYALTHGGRSTVVGHAPTAGAFGEVGRGQYKLPGDLSLQFPTGRPETIDGELLIEGEGVIPDILVPKTEAEVLGEADPVLEAALQALLEGIYP